MGDFPQEFRSRALILGGLLASETSVSNMCTNRKRWKKNTKSWTHCVLKPEVFQKKGLNSQVGAKIYMNKNLFLATTKKKHNAKTTCVSENVWLGNFSPEAADPGQFVHVKVVALRRGLEEALLVPGEISGELEGFPWRTSPKKPFETLDVLSMEFPIGWYIAYWVIIYHLPPVEGTRNSYWF